MPQTNPVVEPRATLANSPDNPPVVAVDPHMSCDPFNNLAGVSLDRSVSDEYVHPAAPMLIGRLSLSGVLVAAVTTSIEVQFSL